MDNLLDLIDSWSYPNESELIPLKVKSKSKRIYKRRCIFDHDCERGINTGKCLECIAAGYTEQDIRKRYGTNGYKRRGDLRKKLLRQATPSWISDDYLKPSIDHIVPLEGHYFLDDGRRINVCGLNVPWNLQIITHRENCIKGNQMNERDLEIACSLSKEIS